MRVKSSLLTLAAALCLLGSARAGAQEQGSAAGAPVVPASVATGASSSSLDAVSTDAGATRYQLGPGDVLNLRVFGEPTITGEYTVDEDGNIDVPLAGVVPAMCRTDLEVKKDVITGLRKYLKNPSVTLTIRERQSRPHAIVFGAVRSASRVQMNRRIRLIELLAVSGGTTEQAGGDIQVYHTTPVMCPSPTDIIEQQEAKKTEDAFAVPFTIYKLEDVKLGKTDSNPYIRPGDIVIVTDAPPIFVTGPGVMSQANLYLKNNMSLTRAIAQVGGVKRNAKSDKVKIYRQKLGQLEPEVIVVNYDAIRKQKEKDVALQPYDIIEVWDQSQWSWKQLPNTLAGFAMTGAGQAVGNVPVRIIN
jgi:polysaccharide export outer membrane protein